MSSNSLESKTVSRLAGVTKTYTDGGGRVMAVDGATISVARGELVGVVGPSGSGKTTLLNIMSMLETPSSGEVFFEEMAVREIPAAERRRLRLAKVGLIFQQLRLIPTLSALENIELPMVLLSRQRSYQRERARELIESMGLAGKENRRPAGLSVGEQQRVAIARALVNDPELVVADEPTSQLDLASGRKVVEILEEVRSERNAAVVLSTHDPGIGELLDRVYQMRDGVLVEK
jgi:putative ABC transport system ATP-binding protein